MAASPAAGAPAPFLFATCQIGAEPALKSELARRRPDFRFAFSRPGFLTFKVPAVALADDLDLRTTFARASGWSLGKVAEPDLVTQAAAVWQLAGERPYQAVHVWQRDLAAAGEHGYEPGLTAAADAAAGALRAAFAGSGGAVPPINEAAEPGQRVLDCVLVEPDLWWIGHHRAQSRESCRPGGFFDVNSPADTVSRAYLKLEEGLAWSGLPLQRSDHVVEIGCSPGGASQALLARGCRVTGIDPADVDPRVLAHPQFTHIRKRGAEVRRREFRGVRWLVADMNVAPAYTLTTVEQIVTHPAVAVEGLLLTLKLIDWKLADELPGYVERIGSWGYAHVAARQLAHNRQEVCVAARRAVARRH